MYYIVLSVSGQNESLPTHWVYEIQIKSKHSLECSTTRALSRAIQEWFQRSLRKLCRFEGKKVGDNKAKITRNVFNADSHRRNRANDEQANKEYLKLPAGHTFNPIRFKQNWILFASNSWDKCWSILNSNRIDCIDAHQTIRIRILLKISALKKYLMNRWPLALFAFENYIYP